METVRISEEKKDFFLQVYQVVRLIPKGRVSTYGAIAEFLGRKGSARMVGWAMNASHKQTKPVPAHRVVNRNGLLSGKQHFSYEKEMQDRLEKEGIEVKNDQVVNFHKLFWNPSKALDLHK